MDDIAEQILRDIERLEDRSVTTDKIRMKVINKLSDVVEKMEFDPNNDKSTITLAKVATTDSLLKALNDVDSQFSNIVKLKQRVKASEDNEDNAQLMSKTITEFLKTVSTVKPEPNNESPEETEKILDEISEKENFKILDSELEISTTSAQDLEA